MPTRYAIGPSIGVARLGNSPESFYLEPDVIAALPIECDSYGNVIFGGDHPKRVRTFKDAEGRVRRQGSVFRVYRLDETHPKGEELTLEHPDVLSIEWTVHLTNKKAVWFNYAELSGNLLYGPTNSYEARHVERRNADVAPSERQTLIIDPGPRTISGARQAAELDKRSAPPSYKYASFPALPKFGQQIVTLGRVLTDGAGRLIVLGGLGQSGGNTPISSFAGADSWHDDIADGPVNCRVVLKNSETIELRAWCIVGSPKFVPEITNVVTLDDTMWDVAVRHLGAAPDMFANGKFRDDCKVNFRRDVVPILNRPGPYRWVANTPAMNSVSPPPLRRERRLGRCCTASASLSEMLSTPEP